MIFKRSNSKSKSSEIANARFARLKLNKYTYLLQVFANHALLFVFVCICVRLLRAAARERNRCKSECERVKERQHAIKTVRTICTRTYGQQNHNRWRREMMLIQGQLHSAVILATTWQHLSHSTYARTHTHIHTCTHRHTDFEILKHCQIYFYIL